jgi:hypothetical protein
MNNNGNGRPRFENRFSESEFDDIEDLTPGYQDIYQEAKELIVENHRLQVIVANLERDVRYIEIDRQAARFEIARAFAAKLKRIRERTNR